MNIYKKTMFVIILIVFFFFSPSFHLFFFLFLFFLFLSFFFLIMNILKNLYNRYSLFVLKHNTQVTTFESLLRGLLFIIPGRYQESEFVSEGGNSLISLLSLFHDKINIDYLRKNSNDLQTQQYLRYVPVKRLDSYLTLLSMIQTIELTCEIFIS